MVSVITTWASHFRVTFQFIPDTWALFDSSQFISFSSVVSFNPIHSINIDFTLATFQT